MSALVSSKSHQMSAHACPFSEVEVVVSIDTQYLVNDLDTTQVFDIHK